MTAQKIAPLWIDEQIARSKHGLFSVEQIVKVENHTSRRSAADALIAHERPLLDRVEGFIEHGGLQHALVTELCVGEKVSGVLLAALANLVGSRKSAMRFDHAQNAVDLRV